MGRPRKILEGQEEGVANVETTPVSAGQVIGSVDPRDARLAKAEQEINELKELVKEKDRRVNQPKKADKQIATVMFLKTGVVENDVEVELPVVEVCQVRDVGGVQSIKLVTLNKEGQEEPHEMEYLNAMRDNRRYKVEIVSMDKKTFTTHQGSIPQEFTTRAPADEVNRRDSYGNPYIPRTFILEEDKVEAKAIIKFLEGPWQDVTIEVDAQACLNK